MNEVDMTREVVIDVEAPVTGLPGGEQGMLMET